MSHFNFKVDGQKLSVVAPSTVVADTVNYLTADFEFSSDWSGLIKYVHFINNGTQHDLELVNDKITEEEGLNLYAGYWTAWVHGSEFQNGELVKRATSSKVNFRVTSSGLINGEPFPSLTMTIGEKIVAQAEDAKTKSIEASEEAIEARDVAIANAQLASNNAIRSANAANQAADSLQQTAKALASVVEAAEAFHTNYENTLKLATRVDNQVEQANNLTIEAKKASELADKRAYDSAQAAIASETKAKEAAQSAFEASMAANDAKEILGMAENVGEVLNDVNEAVETGIDRINVKASSLAGMIENTVNSGVTRVNQETSAGVQSLQSTGASERKRLSDATTVAVNQVQTKVNDASVAANRAEAALRQLEALGIVTLHFCTTEEVLDGKPAIAEPDEHTIYFIPNQSSNNSNMYDEFVWKGHWEQFGSAGLTVDISEFLTDINSDLAILKNTGLTAESGKVWGTTESGADWVDMPEGSDRALSNLSYDEETESIRFTDTENVYANKEEVTELKDSLKQVESRLYESIDEISGRVETLEHEPKVPETLIEQVNNNTKVNNEQNRRLTNLEYASRGVLYREDVNESEDYVKDIPSDVMPYGTFDKLGGKTIVYNQMIGENYPKAVDGEFYEQTVEDKAESFDVDKLIGKTVIWNQLAKISTQANSENNGISFTNNNDGSINLNGTSTGSTAYYNTLIVPNIIKDHVYYFPFIDSSRLYIRYWNEGGGAADKQNAIEKAIINSNETAFYLRIAEGNTFNNEKIYFMYFDLTAMFGTGNEPDLETCKKIFTEDYYPYSEPVLANVNAENVVSRGKNLFDSKNATVLFNANYKNTVISRDENRIVIHFPEVLANFMIFKIGETKDFLGKRLFLSIKNRPVSCAIIACKNDGTGRTNVNNDVITNDLPPLLAVRLYTQNGGAEADYSFEEIQVEEGNTATEYSKYHEPDIRTASTIIQKYFPTGMKSAGSVADELDLKRGVMVQRVGSVDMGTLTWGKHSSIANWFQCSRFPDGKINGHLMTAWYQETTVDNSSIPDKTIKMPAAFDYPIARLILKDSSFNDGASIASGLSGQILYYELATPIETPIDPTDLSILRSIWCEQGGTITYENALNVALPIGVSETFNLTEWSHPLDSTHKYNHNGTLVNGVSALDVSNKDYLIDMTRAGVEDVGAFVGSFEGKNDGELVSADVVSMVVKGKNLWDEEWDTGGILSTNGEEINSASIRSKNLIPVEPNGTYFIVNNGTGNLYFKGYDINKNPVGDVWIGNYKNKSMTVPSGIYYVRFMSLASYGSQYNNDIAIIKGTSGSYVPYKEPKVTVLEDIIKKYFPEGMHSARTVSDVFDVENGVLIRRIRTYRLDGSEAWQLSTTGADTRTVRFMLPTTGINDAAIGVCPQFKYVTEGVSTDNELIGFNGNRMFLRLLKSKLNNVSVNGLRNYLLEYPVDLYVELAEPIITPLDTEDIEALKTLQIEAGGTLTFIQSNDKFHLPVPNKETFLVKTGGVS